MIVIVMLAGAIGALLRFLITRLIAAPTGVLIVNVVGSLVAGILVAATSGDLQLILITGFCGGLTTFSTLGVETVQFAMSGRWRTAVGSILGNLVLGVAAAALGAGVTTALLAM